MSIKPVSQDYQKGWNDALELGKKIALSIDSNRGNEKLIAEELEKRKYDNAQV